MRVLAPFVVIWAVPVAASASLVGALGGSMHAIVGVNGQQHNSVLMLSMPGPGTTSAAFFTHTRTTVGYSVTETEEAAQIDLTFDMLAGYVLGSTCMSTGMAIVMPSVDVYYELSGHLTAAPGQPQAGVQMDARLLDSSNTALFIHDSTSHGVNAGESLVLGAPLDGDVMSGSISGVLSAGATYRLLYTNILNSSAFSDPVALGGILTMRLSAIPSPGTTFVAAVGVLAVARRRPNR